MDREYKEMMFGAMFDELDRLQADKLYTDGELQKEALNVGGIIQGIKGGAKSLAKNPSGFMTNVRRAYQSKAPAGLAGVPKRIGNVLKTDEGKLIGAGLGGAAALGVAGSVMRPRQ
jgi:hypothetical protein